MLKFILAIGLSLFALTLARSVEPAVEEKFLPVTVPFPGARLQSVMCDGSGLRQNPGDDTMKTFFMCMRSGAESTMMYTCPNGTLFNRIARVCDHEANVLNGLNVMCSDSDGNPLPYGNYEDTNNCRMFYMCFMGVGFHQHCAAGTVFDPSTESCSFYDEGQC